MRVNTLQLSLVAVLLYALHPLAQTQQAQAYPSFAGTWVPVDPNRSNQLFDAGLTAVPGDGQLLIEQRHGQLGVTINMPDRKLNVFIAMVAEPFRKSMVYRVNEGVRVGGEGAGPLQQGVGNWVGNQLVIPSPGGAHIYQTAFLLDGERLKRDTVAGPTADRAATITEFFSRAK